ncbi:hypothetical protein SAMN05443999_101555 [Roseovarius azorensis]|uniref:Uncharacterized protein n=1 Tax=Roseovarius azorensis TaxID=1287727 RepID=A0A1H7HJW8_9RHOB|nr:hypothetical protein [Roseovarius azorensis]SEK50594.1 hypothetical protein SAMN05443999_101555 [Roseovarius azorensis]
MKRDPLDPKQLICESYRIEGIGPGECRSIFLDWALSLPEGQDVQAALAALVARYEPSHPDHPMTQVLRDGRGASTAPRRRGGWRSRPRQS